MIKDKGKAIMIEPEVPLKRKDQVALDEDLARNLQAQLEAELIEEERLARKKEEEANIALIESWDNTQAMMEADFELAQRLQTEEQGEITIEERSRLFVELMNKRKKHFAMLRAEEKRRKPPTKAQKRNLMSTYLKNMGGYKHNQLKSKSYEEIQKLFDNEMRRVNTFIPMDSEVVKSKKGTEESSKGTKDELESDKSKKAESSEEKAKGSRKKILGKKRAGKEQQQESSKRQRMKDDKETDEHEEVEVDDEAELKKHLVIVKDDDIAIDAIPLATKQPVIVEYKLLKEGTMVHYQLIRADGSSKRYSSMIRMLQDIDREDLETLWKLVKTKHGDTRPEDEHERVLWGDLKVMFEPDIKSDVWRNLQGYTVTIWKLYDSCRVHFVRLKFYGFHNWYQSHGALDLGFYKVLQSNLMKKRAMTQDLKLQRIRLLKENSSEVSLVIGQKKKIKIGFQIGTERITHTRMFGFGLHILKSLKLTNLNVEDRLAFGVSLRMFTRSIVIQKRVEDLQLGVKSYQKKLNITKQNTYKSDLKRRDAYTAYSNPRGFIYQNKDKKNKLMRIDELHKFSDGTLDDVRTALNDRLKGIRMEYLPQTIWRQSDRERAKAMIQAIDKQLKSRRIMRSLERFVGGRPYGGDLRLLQRTI
ncbi:hypothetical protein Tco_0580860 [Tanacetum coccineum]